MKTFRFDKLVRDNTIPRVEETGGTVQLKELTTAEYEIELYKKAAEEITECWRADTDEERLEEFGDILDVIDMLKEHYGFDEEQLAVARARKQAERGGFAKKLFFETITVPEGSRWDTYCSERPEKYPEEK